jgi:hypothetical protein
MGPLDPLPFVRPVAGEPPAPLDVEPGTWRQVAARDLRLRAAPDPAAPELDRLEIEAPLRVLGVAGDWLRVELRGGRRGFVAGRLTEPASSIRASGVDEAASLLDNGGTGAGRLGHESTY